MAESKQYQFRATGGLEAGLLSVWNKGQSTTENLIRILWAGIESLQHMKQLKAKYRGES